MVFSSIVFILYFLPAFLICYYLVGKAYKNIVILVFSIFFYSWGAPKFIFVILGTTYLDFHLVRWMDQSTHEIRRKILLLISLSVNLGLLFYFKYSNFFIENVNVFLSWLGMDAIHWTKLILPIGISFYTFETITYVVDVYRRIHKPLHHFWDYQTYIILFPKLIAGPIVRYHDLADQINDRSDQDTYEHKLTGFYRFVLGLSKKVILANHMGHYADEIFSGDYINQSSTTAWAGILAYTFQIYFDFSGYSDMAIGIAKMIGFRFPENFDNPYISGSITEFWRRWHMTLGSWMKNYLYIPLGGNQVAHTSRLYLNLWLVFLASGLWHGASWSFVIWGAYHGCWLVIERMFLSKVYERMESGWLRMIRTVWCFTLVMIGWVFFRIEEVDKAFLYLRSMFQFSFENNFQPDSAFYFYGILCLVFAFFAYTQAGKKVQALLYSETYTLERHYRMAGVSLVLLSLCIAMISSSGFNPFIYFRF